MSPPESELWGCSHCGPGATCQCHGVARAPAECVEAPHARRERHADYAPKPWAAVAVFVAVALVIGTLAHEVGRLQLHQARSAVAKELRAIAQVKAERIANWLTTRRDDAATLTQDPLLTAAVRAYLGGPSASHGALTVELGARLRALQRVRGYNKVLLVDAKGHVRLALGAKGVLSVQHKGARRSLTTQAREAVQRALRRGVVVVSGLRLTVSAKRAELVFAAPLTAARAVLLLRVNPNRFLIPLLRRWPIRGRSGEAFLVAQHGSTLSYGLEPGEVGASEAGSREPPREARQLSRLLASGGTDEPVNARGRMVFAAVQPVAGSPWLLVAQVNQSDVLARLKSARRLLVSAAVLLILAAALATALWWRTQRLRFAQLKREEQLRREALLRHFEYLSRFANDIVVLTDDAGRITEANDRAIEAYGYRRTELIGMPMQALRAEASRPEFRAEGRTDGGVVYEVLHRRKDGSVFPVEVSLRVIDPDSRGHAQAIIRDVSERKRADEQLRFQAHMLDMVGEAVIVTDAGGAITYWNRHAAELYGWSADAVRGRAVLDVMLGDGSREHLVPLLEAKRAGRTWSGELEVRHHSGYGFLAFVNVSPILDAQGEVVGAISVSRDITARKQVERKLLYLAQYDALTDLPNRALFCDRLSQAMARTKRTGAMLALLFLDIDRFKEINDTLGHAAGDVLLKEVSCRLRTTLCQTDSIARLGGDEFTIALEAINDSVEAEALARALLDGFAQPLRIEDREVYVTASIGIALYPADVDDIDELLKAADIAMYQAKQEGGNGYQFYSRERHAKSSVRLTLEVKLRQALKRGELSLAYQPRVCGRSGAVSGFEALLRWDNPELGTVPPAQFIGLAEETGLIIPIGDWVIREACRQSRAWSDAGKGVAVSVNLSARQFRQKDLVAKVMDALRDTGADPTRLELEITETLIMQQSAHTVSTLAALREEGVRLSIDDFGTGYSSLAYLKRFPVHALKIDQSFIRDVTVDADDAAIVRAIVSMAKHLKLATVAEGVETRAHLEFLEDLGTDEYQGYYFSLPLKAEDVPWSFASAAVGRRKVRMGTLTVVSS